MRHLTLTGRKIVLGLVSAPIAVLCVVSFPSRNGSTVNMEGEGSGVGGRATSMVLIRGDVAAPIVPGAMVPLNLSLRNANSVDLVVENLTVTLRKVVAPQADAEHPCGLEDFTVRQVPTGVRLTLRRNRSTGIAALGLGPESGPAVGMLNRPVNQDGCQGAQLMLGYSASGAQVD